MLAYLLISELDENCLSTGAAYPEGGKEAVLPSLVAGA